MINWVLMDNATLKTTKINFVAKSKINENKIVDRIRMESNALVYLTIPKYSLKTKKDIVVAEIQKKYNNAVSCVRKRLKSKLLYSA